MAACLTTRHARSDAGSAADICGEVTCERPRFLAGACLGKGKGVHQLIQPAAPGLLTNVLVKHLSPACTATPVTAHTVNKPRSTPTSREAVISDMFAVMWSTLLKHCVKMVPVEPLDGFAGAETAHDF